MNQNKERYIIAGIIFVVVLGFSIFCGISISNMSIKTRPETDTETEEPESDDETSETAETLIPPMTSSEGEKDKEDNQESGKEAEKETESATSSENEKQSSISALSDSELNNIQASYNGDLKSFYTNGDREERNISKIALAFSAEFSDKFSGTFVFTDVTRPTTSINILLTMEYGQTEPLLTVLAQKGIKATFFVNKYYASGNPGIVQRIIAEGHDLGSLGSSTPANGLASCGLQDQMNDIMDLHNYIAQTYNYQMTKFYYLYDKYTDQSVKMVTSMGYHVNFYSTTYADYNPTPASINADSMCADLAAKLHNGSIVALHASNPNGVAAIAGYIDYAFNHGFNFELTP